MKVISFKATRVPALMFLFSYFMITACGGGSGDSSSSGSTSSSTGSTSSGSTSSTSSGGPGISSTTPADGGTGIATNTTVSATFSETMLDTSIDANSYTLSSSLGAVPSTVTYDGSTNTAELTPNADLVMLRTYTANLSNSITNLSGNAIADTSWSFTTADGSWGTASFIDSNLTVDSHGHKIAHAPNGTAISVWSEGGIGVYARHYFPNTGWSNPIQLDNNVSGSAYPNIALDKDGNAVALWRQGETLGGINATWACYYTAGGSWSAPEIISETYGAVNNSTDTVDSEPYQVAFDSNGNAFAVWHQSHGTYWNIWTNKYTKGTGWETPIKIENVAGNSGYPIIKFDNNDNATVVWRTGDPYLSVYANRYTSGSGWGTAQLIESYTQRSALAHDFTIDSSGNVLVVWYQEFNGARDSIWFNRYTVGAGWGTESQIDIMTTDRSITPKIAMLNDSDAIVVWQSSTNSNYNTWASRYTVNTGWSAPEPVQSESSVSIGYHEIASDNSGNAMVVWSHTPAGSTNPDLNAIRYSHSTGWSSPTVIETDAVGSGRAIVPRISIHKGTGKAIAVWKQSDGTRHNIVANHFE